MATPEQALRRQAVARRIVYLLVAVAVVVPFIYPVELPGEPSEWAKKLHERIARLEPGSPVLFSFDYDPASQAELYPMSLALLHHCFQRDLHPIVMTHWPNGVGLCKELVETAAEEYGKKSGDDYVFLAYKPGGRDLVLNMGESLQGAFDKDYYGKPTEGMPALEGVRSLKDIPVVVDIAAGNTVEMWIAYGRDRFGFDLGAGCTAVIAPDLYPFLSSGQLIGFLGGLRGAADYERLIDREGDATKGMPSQSLVHLLIIVLILGANARFLIRRFTATSEE